jgi:hypothetical protein
LKSTDTRGGLLVLTGSHSGKSRTARLMESLECVLEKNRFGPQIMRERVQHASGSAAAARSQAGEISAAPPAPIAVTRKLRRDKRSWPVFKGLSPFIFYSHSDV